MKIVVTGGAGFVGSNLINHLIEQTDNKIVVVDNGSNGRFDRIKESDNIEIVRSCASEVSNYEEHLKDCDYLFHLACVQISKSNECPYEDLQANSISTLNILEYFRRNETNLKKIIYTSSCSVYGNSETFPIIENQILDTSTIYSSTKLLGENYMKIYSKDYGIPSVILRYSNIYGYNQTPEDRICGVIGKFIYSIIHDKEVITFGDGEFTRDYTFIEDAISATIESAFSDKRDGQIYNVSTNYSYSVNQIIDILKQKMGEFEVKSTDNRIIDNIKDRKISYDKIKKDLGWYPKNDIYEGISKTIDWFVKNKI